MTHEEFATKMQEIIVNGRNDLEMIHCEMDELMCKVLTDHGYTSGVEIFEKQEKWYA